MRHILLAVLLLGTHGLAADITGAPAVEILTSSENGLVARVTFDAAPGKEINLGLMAVPENAELVGSATSLESNGLSTDQLPTLRLGEPVLVRDFRAVPVAIRCPSTITAAYIVMDVSLSIAGPTAGMAAFRGYLPENFQRLLQPHVLNWDQVELEQRGPGLRYLIITADNLYDAAWTLFDWKERKGLAPQMTKVSDIPGGTSDFDIRQYIQDVYQTTGTLEYVLLVGDYGANPQGIPSHSYYNQVSGGDFLSDKYYATISGSDDLPDVFLGRLPASSPGQLAAFTDKILAYERGDGDGPWMERAVMAAGNQHSSQPETKRTIRNQLLAFGFDMVDTVFAPGQSAVDLINAVNDGRMILNYRGGVADRESWGAISFTQDHCYYLANGARRPLVLSIICLTADFSYTGGSYGECLGESWIRCNGGAIGFFGATHITHTFINNELDFGIFDALINQGLRSMGAVTDAGLYYMFNHYAYGDTVQVQLRQYVLLGDPELALWTHEPYTMSVEHPASVPQGQSDVTVSTGVGGALVCLRGAGVYEAYYADGAGNAYFTITPTSSDNIDVTVTKPGFFPYQGQITVTASYHIEGTILTEDGGTLEGATVTLTGDASHQATTNVDGWYRFNDLNQGGTYTVTPSYSNSIGAWTFDPESRTYENLQGDQWSQNYTAYVPRYTLAGRTRTSGGAALEGVAVTLTGASSDETTTNQDGWYQFGNLRGGLSYTLTPSYTPQEGAWSFEPEDRSIGFLDQDRWNQDFTGTPPFYGITGTVTAETGEAVEGVKIILSGDGADTTHSNVQGRFSLGPLAGGASYTVTPYYTPVEGAWSFDPSSYDFSPLTGPETADFQGTRPRYSVSGVVTTRDSQGLEGVLVRLSDGKVDSSLTDQEGAYSLENLPGGFSYAVTPHLAYDDSVNWGFTPKAVSIDTLVGSLNNVGFLAQLPVLLYVGDGLGQPGSSGNPVDLSVDNATYQTVSLDSVAFTLLYSSAFGYHIPTESGVITVGRAEDMTVSYAVDETNEAACSLFVTLSGPGVLESGSDPVLRLLLDVDAEADTSRATVLSFVTASLWDITGVLIPVDSHDTGVFGSGVSSAPSPKEYRLNFSPPVPNPTTGEVQFLFQLPRTARTTVVIRDLNGRVVTKLRQGILSPGEHSVRWDGKTESGNMLPNGSYHCQLVAGGETAHRLVVFLR